MDISAKKIGWMPWRGRAWSKPDVKQKEPKRSVRFPERPVSPEYSTCLPFWTLSNFYTSKLKFQLGILLGVFFKVGLHLYCSEHRARFSEYFCFITIISRPVFAYPFKLVFLMVTASDVNSFLSLINDQCNNSVHLYLSSLLVLHFLAGHCQRTLAKAVHSGRHDWVEPDEKFYLGGDEQSRTGKSLCVERGEQIFCLLFFRNFRRRSEVKFQLQILWKCNNPQSFVEVDLSSEVNRERNVE